MEGLAWQSALILLAAHCSHVAVGEPEPAKLLKVPRIYNALITTDEELVPSQAYPAVAPVLRPAYHPLSYVVYGNGNGDLGGSIIQHNGGPAYQDGGQPANYARQGIPQPGQQALPGPQQEQGTQQQYQGELPGQQQYQGPLPGQQQYQGPLPGKQQYQGPLPGQQQYQGPQPGQQQYQGPLPGQQQYRDPLPGQQQPQGGQGPPPIYSLQAKQRPPVIDDQVKNNRNPDIPDVPPPPLPVRAPGSGNNSERKPPPNYPPPPSAAIF